MRGVNYTLPPRPPKMPRRNAWGELHGTAATSKNTARHSAPNLIPHPHPHQISFRTRTRTKSQVCRYADLATRGSHEPADIFGAASPVLGDSQVMLGVQASPEILPL